MWMPSINKLCRYLGETKKTVNRIRKYISRSRYFLVLFMYFIFNRFLSISAIDRMVYLNNRPLGWLRREISRDPPSGPLTPLRLDRVPKPPLSLPASAAENVLTCRTIGKSACDRAICIFRNWVCQQTWKTSTSP